MCSILQQFVPRIIHPVKPKTLPQPLILIRRFCLKIFLPLANQSQLKKLICPSRGLLGQDCSSFWGRGSLSRFSIGFGFYSHASWGATKDKDGVTTSKADKSANQAPKLQIKLKKYDLFYNLIRTFVRILCLFAYHCCRFILFLYLFALLY